MTDIHQWNIQITGEQPPKCNEYISQFDCITAGCFWYDGSCHSSPKAETPWMYVLAGGIIAIGAITILLRRRKQ